MPEDSTLIQVGFNYSLNYAFVVANPNSSAQIFMYLPIGLAYGLSIKEDQVTMQQPESVRHSEYLRIHHHTRDRLDPK